MLSGWEGVNAEASLDEAVEAGLRLRGNWPTSRVLIEFGVTLWALWTLPAGEATEERGLRSLLTVLVGLGHGSWVRHESSCGVARCRSARWRSGVYGGVDTTGWGSANMAAGEGVKACTMLGLAMISTSSPVCKVYARKHKPGRV